MAEELTGSMDEAAPPRWRGIWASVGALAATVLLIGLITLVTLSNRDRAEALGFERQTQETVLLTRNVDATIARAEAALGRYVLDEDERTGTIYYNEWRRAGRQIAQLQRVVRGDAEQAGRVAELRALYDRRGEELAGAATAAFRGEGRGGLDLFYQAARSDSIAELRRALDDIARIANERLRERQVETQLFAARADSFTEWLGWLAVLVAAGAVALAWMAVRAFAETRAAARRAESESWRAAALDEAVRARTRELSEANERLRAEAAERAAAEAQLRQVQKMEAVGQLTGGIAHDFNNMLAVIVGGLDLARRKLHGPAREAEFHIDNAMEGAHRAAALTRRLLAFARAEPLLPEAVAPSELVEGMLDLVDRTIGERIAVQTRFPAEPWHVWADPNQLENAILNLCVNARDAMEGSGQLTISVDNVALAEGEVDDLAAGDYVRIAVADTGSGIAPEHLDRVFEPFFTTKEVGKGTGLGLSQIFGFARQSHGDVTIDSTVGEGTRVAIYLPRSASAADAAQRPAEAPRETAPDAPTGGASILVVEDDPRVSRATVSALEELGHRPVACSTGADALALLEREGGIDLVLTDVMMPEMTGPELARVVRARWPRVGILFVTGYVGEAGDAEDLAGADLLRKPFTVNALAGAVATALSHRLSGSRPSAASAAAG